MAQFDRGLSCRHCSPVLGQCELCVPHLNADLILDLLHTHLRLPIFHLCTNLCGLTSAVAYRDVQGYAYTLVRGARINRLIQGGPIAYGLGRWNVAGAGDWYWRSGATKGLLQR